MTDPTQEVEIETSFEKDNFTSRRTTGHNLFDPDSLITGEESAKGLTYANSSRVFPSAEIREKAIRGELTQAEIIEKYPRVLHAQAADSLAGAQPGIICLIQRRCNARWLWCRTGKD